MRHRAVRVAGIEVGEGQADLRVLVVRPNGERALVGARGVGHATELLVGGRRGRGRPRTSPDTARSPRPAPGRHLSQRDAARRRLAAQVVSEEVIGIGGDGLAGEVAGAGVVLPSMASTAWR